MTPPSFKDSFRERGGVQKSPFIHLRLHSCYSLLEGAFFIQDLPRLCKRHGMPAVALTDTANIFGALEFSKTLSQEGIQPIVGCSLPLALDPDNKLKLPRDIEKGYVAVMVKDEGGYKNLLKLASYCTMHATSQNAPCLELRELLEYQEGLIVLSGGFEGPLHRLILHGHIHQALQLLQKLKEGFQDRLYVELQRHGLAEERKVEPHLLRWALEENLPLVATNEAYFEKKEDYEAHDALLCIAQGEVVASQNRRHLTPEHTFKSTQEMEELFADLPEAIENTREIMFRCAYCPRVQSPQLPHFILEKESKKESEGVSIDEREKDLLLHRAHEGLKARLSVAGPCVGHQDGDYKERLLYELDIITSMNFSGYFLIVADFILWAKEQDIPVGPGRGSGAGSLVAWALGITNLDPLAFGLLFERFLNPERISMPDFDIDFCQDRRDEVINYVKERYGAECVAHIITFGKLQARAVLRDVGRVLQIPYSQVDRLCKFVPYIVGVQKALESAINTEPGLRKERDADPLVARMFDIALKLEGLYRHASVHAAGIVISHEKLLDHLALYKDDNSNLILTQFTMSWVEASGLVKFDFLGLKTLTIISNTLKLIKNNRGESINIDTIPLDDEATFALLSRGDSMGVFQLEGRGMSDALKRMKPTDLKDIIALVALYRPGPMDNVSSYIQRKHGLEEVEDLHPLLRELLEETYGIIIYQEQVMEIARKLSGYSLGEADILRRAMGKKIQKEMDAQEERFVKGAVERGVSSRAATSIFELVGRFAGYGFNKSHAAAYGLIAYQTAYLKTHYPLEFLAAIMSADIHNVDKLNLFASEAKRLGIPVFPPHINRSSALFVPAKDEKTQKDCIYYALGAIKNTGIEAMKTLVEIREKGGAFQSVDDFLSRVDSKCVTKRSLENLIKSGAFDEFETNRAKLWTHIEKLTRYIVTSKKDEAQITFFDVGLSKGGEDTLVTSLGDVAPWSPIEALQREFDVFGFYLSGHPAELFEKQLKVLKVRSYQELLENGTTMTTWVVGVVTRFRVRRSKRGKVFAFVSCLDVTGAFDVLVFGDLFEQSRDMIKEGATLAFCVEVDWSRAQTDAIQENAEIPEQVMRLRAVAVTSLEERLKALKRLVKLFLKDQEDLLALQQVLDRHKGFQEHFDLVVSIERVAIEGTAHHTVLTLKNIAVDPETFLELVREKGWVYEESFALSLAHSS